MPTITKEIEIDDSDIEELAGNMNEDDAMSLIKTLDNGVGDWDFTKRVIQELYKDWRKEFPDDEIELCDATLSGSAEEETEKADDAQPKDHGHVYRDGACWCGATP